MLKDLYQELILDHNKRPRNRRRLDEANHQAEGFNPLCGDRVKVYVELEDDVVVETTFEGSGCAIATASASIMAETLKGKTLAEAKLLFKQFHEMVTGTADASELSPELGKLAVFAGVCDYPARVKCATLAWHTLNAALESQGGVVSTE